MKTTVTGRHMELTSTLKDYAESKVKKINKYFGNIIEVHVVLSVEKYRHIAEVTIHLDGVNIKSKGETEDMYASIDQVMDKIESQVKKRKSKYHNHANKKENIDEVLSNNLTRNKETDYFSPKPSSGEIVKSLKFAPKPMSPDEAALQLRISQDQFLVFSNSLTNMVNVIYKKNDGNFGLIESEINQNS